MELIEPLLCEVIVTSYEGQLDEKTGRYNGHGVAAMDNKCSYEGYFKNGLFHGKGKFHWGDGVTFEGTFVTGLMKGKGVYKWPDGSVYDGQIDDGKRHGKGVFKCSAGQVYDGDWQEGKRHGDGKMFYNPEKTIVFTGEWRNGKRNGYGSMRYMSGNTYEGEWSDDMKCGRGVMIWRDVDEVYTGDWANDKPHGRGEHIWGDGGSKSLQKQICNMYRGEWFEGQRQGRGAFFYANGSQYNGDWLGNQKHGEGIFIHPDGKIVAATFERDRMIQPEAPQARATEDVNVQTRLNIADVLLRFPAPSALAPSPEAASAKLRTIDRLIVGSAGSVAGSVVGSVTASVVVDSTRGAGRFDAQVRELERLLLRYNSVTRNYYKRTSELANRRRQREISVLSVSDAYTGAWPKVEQTLYQARNFSKRLFCMSLDQMRRFLREIGVIGPAFNSYDLTLCLRRMRDQHSQVAEQLLYTYRCKRVAKAYGGAEASSVPVFSGDSCAKLLTIMENSFFGFQDGTLRCEGDTVHSYDADPRQPLLEREFCELVVRCIADSALKNGSGSGQSLYYIAFQMFAEKIQPMSVDWSSSQAPPEIVALYADSVQEVCRALSTRALKDIWLKLVAAARSQGLREAELEPLAQVRHVVGYFLSLKGSALPTEVTAVDLLVALGCPTIIPVAPAPADGGLDSLYASLDYSWLGKVVDFDDFFAFLCGLILQDLWVFNKKPVAAAAAEPDKESVEVSEEKKGPADGDEATAGGEGSSAFASEVDDPEENMDLKEKLFHRLTKWVEFIDRSPTASNITL